MSKIGQLRDLAKERTDGKKLLGERASPNAARRPLPVLVALLQEHEQDGALPTSGGGRSPHGSREMPSSTASTPSLIVR